MLQNALEFATGDQYVEKYKDKTAVMVELDYCEEYGYSAEMVELTRLDDRVMSGESNKDILTNVAALRKQLGISDTRIVTLPPQRRRGIAQVVLSKPLGPYYTCISLASTEYQRDEVIQVWNEQPILSVEMLVYKDFPLMELSSHRLRRADELTLSFEDRNTAEILDLLMIVKMNCRILNIRNRSFDNRMGLAYYARLRHKWPNLIHVRKG